MKNNSNDTIRSPKRKPEKLLIYEALLTLNQDFEQVLETVAGLEELTAFRSRLPRKFLRALQVAVEETRAGANFELIHILQAIEERDWSRFGRLRRQLEDSNIVPTELQG